MERASIDQVTRDGMIWKINDERNKGLRYSDGTVKTFYPDKPHLNRYGYPHRTQRCPECGQWECDPEGIGHYKG
jgi:hypothetical protein